MFTFVDGFRGGVDRPARSRRGRGSSSGSPCGHPEGLEKPRSAAGNAYQSRGPGRHKASKNRPSAQPQADESLLKPTNADVVKFPRERLGPAPGRQTVGTLNSQACGIHPLLKVRLSGPDTVYERHGNEGVAERLPGGG